MIQASIFVLFTLLILKLSWPSLKNPRSHGFFRFFAFESIGLEIVLNLTVWFKDPFSILHIISWLFLALSILVALHSFWLIKRRGRPSGNIENTTQLINSGIFRFIRHPLYFSLALMSVGTLLKQIDIWTTLLFAISLISIYLTGKNEETENLAKFGVNYQEYMNNTKMFIPMIF